MRKSILLLTFLALFVGGSTFAKKFKPIKIVNSSDRSIFVSWGYNARQLQSFIVEIPPKKSLKVNDWDVDRPTNIFVTRYFYDNYHRIVNDIKGEIYMLPMGKGIDLKSTSNKLFRSNSLFLKDKDIFTKCTAVHGFVLKSAAECTYPYQVDFKPADRKVFQTFEVGRGFGDEAMAQGMGQLQKFSNALRDAID